MLNCYISQLVEETRQLRRRSVRNSSWIFQAYLRLFYVYRLQQYWVVILLLSCVSACVSWRGTITTIGHGRLNGDESRNTLTKTSGIIYSSIWSLCRYKKLVGFVWLIQEEKTDVWKAELGNEKIAQQINSWHTLTLTRWVVIYLNISHNVSKFSGWKQPWNRTLKQLK